MIVMKFGGSSVESAVAIERVAGIVKKRLDWHPVGVGSALGKTTNKLLAIAAAAIDGKRDEFIRQLHDLRDYHSREARQVVPLEGRAGLDRFLDEHFQELTELVKGLAALCQLHDLRDYHSREARQVVPLEGRAGLDRFLDEHFQELTELVKGLAVLGELTPRSVDAISSYGERLSSYVVTQAFRHC